MYQQTSKFELNLIGSNSQPSDVCSAAIRYRASAIVIDNPIYIPAMLATRMSTRGNWKLIFAVDFADGKEYGFSNKFLRQPGAEAIFGCDGFDILLSARNEVESANEVKSIIDGLKRMNPVFNIRFTIDAFSRDIAQIKRSLSAIKNYPPTMVRLDRHLTMRALDDSKIDEIIKVVREYTAVPLKLGTNINLDRIKKYSGQVSGFDVDLKTAATIVEQLNA